MRALHNKFQNPTKKDFDQETALLFQNATDYVRYHLGSTGHPVPFGSHFWVGAKDGTMFHNIHQATVYRYALKLIEARQAWIDDNDAEQIIRQGPYQAQTAQAIDRFNSIVTAAGIMHGNQAVNLSSYMIGDVAEQVDEEDTAGEILYMVEKDDDYRPKDKKTKKVLPPPPINHTELNAQQSVAEASQIEEMKVAEGGQNDETEVTEGGQDAEMMDTETGGYTAFLAQLALEDAENADEEDMMELE